MPNLIELIAFLVLAYGAWVLAHRYWRGKAIECASAWAKQNGYLARTLGEAKFAMHRQHPSLTFLAKAATGSAEIITLHMAISPMGSWHVERWQLDTTA